MPKPNMMIRERARSGHENNSAAHHAAQGWFRDHGVADPRNVVHYETISEPGGTFGWRPLREPPHPAPVIRTIATGAIPPAAPTVEQRRRVREHLDDAYDAEAGCYFMDGSDEKSAAMLKVPRAWVASIRELFGDDVSRAELDRREREERERNSLAGRVAEAQAIADNLLNLATQAEAEVAKLKALAA